MTVAAGPARWLWFAVGWLAVALGSVGIVVPGLPTTGFFVLAAWAFSRSSPRFERWVLGLPKVGPLVASYRAGDGMPKRAKVVAIGMMVFFVGLSAVVLGSVVAKVAVVALGAVGVWFVGWHVPTSRPMAPTGRMSP